MGGTHTHDLTASFTRPRSPVADPRTETPASRFFIPDAYGIDHYAATAHHDDDDDRGSWSIKSEAYDDDDDDDDEAMAESDWDPREAAVIRREAEARTFMPAPDPIFYLGDTRISSANYTCPRQLRKTVLSNAEPRPLNLVVCIIANAPSKKNGSSKYRLLQVDLGDGVEMDVQAHIGSDLYKVDRRYNPFPEGAIVILEDVRGVFRGSALALDFHPCSRISRCDELGVTWEQLQEWHQKMTMLLPRPPFRRRSRDETLPLAGVSAQSIHPLAKRLRGRCSVDAESSAAKNTNGWIDTVADVDEEETPKTTSAKLQTQCCAQVFLNAIVGSVSLS
ncbi:uncharacterized protein PAN0_021c6050 [Moesziomyces antarcticus]|nr:uncharacterized protein PAN0_021c6050 [Moesziomyces antarcticus]GAK67821.1 hypothetical protein PAN0_021c6050 [Moesziomyces antarcticus]